AVSIPVVANGDVATPGDAIQILQRSCADAVMVGRAHYGSPWAAGALAHAASGTADNSAPQAPMELAGYVIAHYEDMLSLYGVESGLRQARKHLGWYLDRHAPFCPAETRKAILTATDPAVVIASLRLAFADR